MLFIVRIYYPRFWFWTDILRPSVSFPSPLQEVGILCVCLCLVIFLSNLVLYRTDVFQSSLCVHDSQRFGILFSRGKTAVAFRFIFDRWSSFFLSSRVFPAAPILSLVNLTPYMTEITCHTCVRGREKSRRS